MSPVAAQDTRLAGNTDLSAVRSPSDLAPPAHAVIKAYHYWPVLTAEILTGPVGTGQGPSHRKIDGVRTILFFSQPDTTDQATITRRYRQTIESEGGGVLFQCKDANCGPANGDIGPTCAAVMGWYYKGPTDPLDELLAAEAGADIGGWRQVSRLAAEPHRSVAGAESPNTGPQLPTECRFLVGTIPAAHGRPERYVSIFTMNGPFPDKTGVNAVLEIVEASAIVDTNGTVTADMMAADIASTGHVALYGIHFDSEAFEMKPESAPALEQIAVLLRTAPSLRLLIVGHTDNHEGYDAAIALSQHRADAIVATLGRDFAIDVNRLKAVGDGMSAPIASNDSDAGSALNRRIELVKE